MNINRRGIMKKVLALMLSVMMVAALAACGKTATAETTAAAAEAQGPAYKIAICSSPSGVDDGSFNTDNYNGILNFIAENPACTVTPVREETGDTAAALQAVADIVADYDIIVCCGFQFAGIGTLAEENPNVKFILVDSFPTNADGAETEYANIYAMQFREQEGGFLAGVSAAMSTKTGKVAVVNGIAYPSNVNYQYGFMSGVNYANKNFGTAAECVEIASYAGTDVTGANVRGNYVGSFADEATGKVVGQALINEGCDVILVAAGGSGNGVFTAAKEAGDVYIIGCDTNQYKDGVNGDKNIILTSALKCMAINNYRQLNAIKDGTFKGGNYTLGADTDSVGYVKEDGSHQLSGDAIAKCDECFAKIKTGEIVPAANFNGSTPDNFVGLN